MKNNFIFDVYKKQIIIFFFFNKRCQKKRKNNLFPIKSNVVKIETENQNRLHRCPKIEKGSLRRPD